VALTAPEPLAAKHEIAEFNSGVASLDEWLIRRARGNQASGASRTYVLTDGQRVVAYYAVASGSIESAQAPGRFRRNMPNPIPVAVLGRLAIDRAFQGQGLGRALFRDCAIGVTYAADTLGIRGLVVHAISDNAKAFYLALGLDVSPVNPMILMATLADLAALDATAPNPAPPP
jgi:GNAT superfamily N-acetyltransferase